MYTMHIVMVVVVSIVHDALAECCLVFSVSARVCVGAALSRLIGLRQTCNLQLLLNE